MPMGHRVAFPEGNVEQITRPSSTLNEIGTGPKRIYRIPRRRVLYPMNSERVS